MWLVMQALGAATGQHINRTRGRAGTERYGTHSRMGSPGTMGLGKLTCRGAYLPAGHSLVMSARTALLGGVPQHTVPPPLWVELPCGGQAPPLAGNMRMFLHGAQLCSMAHTTADRCGPSLVPVLHATACLGEPRTPWLHCHPHACNPHPWLIYTLGC